VYVCGHAYAYAVFRFNKTRDLSLPDDVKTIFVHEEDAEGWWCIEPGYKNCLFTLTDILSTSITSSYYSTLVVSIDRKGVSRVFFGRNSGKEQCIIF